MPDPMQVLRGARIVLVIDWPSRDVPESLTAAGFEVHVSGGPEPDNYSRYTLEKGEYVVTKTGKPPERADLVYSHRPMEDLESVVEMAQQIGASTVWMHSGLGPDGSKDPRGCWMPLAELAEARRIVESAGLAFIAEPYIGDAAREVAASR